MISVSFHVLCFRLLPSHMFLFSCFATHVLTFLNHSFLRLTFPSCISRPFFASFSFLLSWSFALHSFLPFSKLFTSICPLAPFILDTHTPSPHSLTHYVLFLALSAFDSYLLQTPSAGGKVIGVPLRAKPRASSQSAQSSADWSLDMPELRARFSPRTRMLIINTPHNPTGKVFTREELMQIADIVKGMPYCLWIVC